MKTEAVKPSLPYASDPVFLQRIGFRRACHAVGVVDFRFHDLRHTFASAAGLNGGTMQKPKRALTRKQERLSEEYMVDLNATQAAIRAGYSQQNADKIGPELLGKTRFHIDQALREIALRTTMTAAG